MTKPDQTSENLATSTEIDEAATRPSWVKTIWILTGIIVALLVSLAALAYAYSSSNQSDRTRVAVQKANAAIAAASKAELGSCSFWHDLAVTPLPTTLSATSVLPLILRDSRVAYSQLGCVPPLPTPDPRVAKLLPPGVN